MCVCGLRPTKLLSKSSRRGMASERLHQALLREKSQQQYVLCLSWIQYEYSILSTSRGVSNTLTLGITIEALIAKTRKL